MYLVGTKKYEDKQIKSDKEKSEIIILSGVFLFVNIWVFNSEIIIIR